MSELPDGIGRVEHNGLVYLRSTRLSSLGAPHLFSTRGNRKRAGTGACPYETFDVDLGFKGGASPEAVIRARELACEALGADLSRLTVAGQVHSGRAVVIDERDVGRGARGREDAIPGADGLVTDVPGAVLLILTADCLPVLLFDPQGRIGAFHAGWRGALAGIARNTVGLMVERFRSNPPDLIAVMGPAIQKCCFEVGPEVAERFSIASRGYERQTVIPREGRLFVDLTAFVKNELIHVGLAQENIIDVGLCTSCLPELFYSYRRDRRLVGSQGAMVCM
ncbi:MAG: peptidoglycan editing factor PgeF [Candidatus Coatesbacteria bacterium]|nr:peptidoglycan editing factor PgeF [Candidatus Coatesbacteria bacterium]